MIGRVLLAALTCRSNRAFYDRIAPIYDEVFTDHLSHADTMLNALANRYPDDRARITVLDLGCGTGVMTRRLRTHGFTVIGLDVSLDSLRLQKREDKKASVVQADLRALPLRDDCMKAVVCLGVWRHVEDPERAIDEVRRVLDQEGRFIVGYFPPKLGGLITVPEGTSGRLLIRIYSALLLPFGYRDNVESKSEHQTLRLMSERFDTVVPLSSGLHSHLLEGSSLSKDAAGGQSA